MSSNPVSTRHILFCAAVLFLATVIAVSSARGNELGDGLQYKITGYSFGYDAVVEPADPSNELLFETSRFEPLMITGSTVDMFIEDPFTAAISAKTGQPAPLGMAIAAEYLATPDLAFHGAIGVTTMNWDNFGGSEPNSSWEANLGLVYNIFNSLTYEVHFGYMDTGDLFQQMPSYSDIDTIIMVSNQLTLSF
jgi:hypothetical protein